MEYVLTYTWHMKYEMNMEYVMWNVYYMDMEYVIDIHVIEMSVIDDNRLYVIDYMS